MAGSGGENSKQALGSIGLSQIFEEDRISQLPDPLICQILSHLLTEDSVKTSVLSTRWRSLWLWVPYLELVSCIFQDFNAFKSFGDRFFDSNRVSWIDKVDLTIGATNDVNDDLSYLKSWIDAAVKRKIQHLHVYYPAYIPNEMPPGIFTCGTLVSLKLYGVDLDDVEFVSLPCLKTMHLKFIRYPNDATFERLVSCCPVLEELKILSGCVNGNERVFRVLSTSLKKLKIKTYKNDSIVGAGFVIDSPRLCYLSINDKLSESFIINNINSNAKVDISLPFRLDVFDEASILSKRNSIRRFLSGISKIRDMTICRDTFRLICQYSKIEPLPQFGCVFRLRVTSRVSDLKWLPTFLESFSNLKSLILVWNTNSKTIKTMEYKQLCRFHSFSVPECLLSSLEFVDIKTSISGHFSELMLLRYFLENSKILKKLALRLNHYGTNEKLIVKEVLRIPRCSITCQVVID